jgi:thiamine-monophosphate kinase
MRRQYIFIRKPDFTIIGHMNEASEGINLITTGGSSIPLMAQGWNHGRGE